MKKVINHYAKSPIFLNIFKLLLLASIFVKSPDITEEMTLLLSKADLQMYVLEHTCPHLKSFCFCYSPPFSSASPASHAEPNYSLQCANTL